MIEVYTRHFPGAVTVRSINPNAPITTVTGVKVSELLARPLNPQSSSGARGMSSGFGRRRKGKRR
ncbi:hypothetical protein GF380_04490 [Candidatus Uhrbacteria bacterium]|nr:hypothetical protein [Candidatus Uhrbacteria bacterium]